MELKELEKYIQEQIKKIEKEKEKSTAIISQFDMIKDFVFSENESNDMTNIIMHNIGVFFSVVANLLPYMKKISLSTEKNIIAKAKKYLHSNPYCSNKQLAAECNISLPYLYKIFKTHDSETPNVYRQKALCSQATDLLTRTDLSIEQISSILKFSSSVYFRKIFKEHIGQTPREFRKLHSF